MAKLSNESALQAATAQLLTYNPSPALLELTRV